MGDGSRDRDGGGTLQYQCSKTTRKKKRTKKRKKMKRKRKRKKKRTKKTKKMKRTCNDGDREMKTRMKRKKMRKKKMRNNEWGLVHRESAPAAFDTGGDSPRQPWP